METTTITIEQVALVRLKPDPRNPRIMPDQEMAALEAAISAFGFVQSIVARRSDGRIIGGHQRALAAQRLGLDTVPVTWIEATDRECDALALALNRIGGDWDPPKLAEILAELADVASLSEALAGWDPTFTALAGFDTGEVLAVLAEQLGTASAAEDLTTLARQLAPVAERASATQLGDGYQLGAHRVTCGDAADPDAVRRLCAEDHPAILFTDPPYGVAYHAEPGAQGAASSGRPRGRQTRPLGPIIGDDLPKAEHQRLITAALTNATAVLAPGAAVYVCGGSATTGIYDAAFAAAGIRKSTILVWDKGRPALGRQDYQRQHELIWYGWRAGAAHHFYGDRTQSDVWAVPTDPAASYVHPTQKPVALAARALRNSSRAGETVLDCFGGSGSTLMAAEQTGRRALVLEIDPHYVDVIVARWEAHTGQSATPFRAEAADA